MRADGHQQKGLGANTCFPNPLCCSVGAVLAQLGRDRTVVGEMAKHIFALGDEEEEFLLLGLGKIVRWCWHCCGSVALCGCCWNGVVMLVPYQAGKGKSLYL